MKRTVAVIILIFTLLNISSYFVMRSRAPQYTVFTGAVHYPPDYLYYLSFITQGKDNWLLGANLKSAETRDLQALNWFYVLGGHLGHMLNLSPQFIYQLLVILASIAYLTAAYALCTVCFPKQPMSRLVAFVVFLISNAFPKITHTASGWDFNFFYPFNNIGHPFIRLSNVPHHTLIQAAILSAFF
jgi:phage shock protein PspC (stress-responsive transcriptional regulator)